MRDSNTSNGPSTLEEDVRFRDLAPTIEFMCWVGLAIAPFLRWINGPAVSNDQFAIQMVLVSLAVIGAVGLRAHNWLIRKTNRD